jgi:hypothetical protein
VHLAATGQADFPTAYGQAVVGENGGRAEGHFSWIGHVYLRKLRNYESSLIKRLILFLNV